MKAIKPSKRRQGIDYQELKLLHSTPMLWEANWAQIDETEFLSDMVEYLRTAFPNPEKTDLSGVFAILMRASRIHYGTIVPALDVISAFLDPEYITGEEIELGSNGGMTLLEIAKALEYTRVSGGFIGLDPDPEGRNEEEEPDDILMGVA